MTIWTHSVSWSKFKLALDCPRSLQYTIDKKPFLSSRTNYYQQLGTLVQLVFEHYFNQGVNLKAAGRTEAVMAKVTDRVLASNHYKAMQIDYPAGKSEEGLQEEIKRMVLIGFRQMQQTAVLPKKVASEQKWNSVFRGHRMFGMIDFDVHYGQNHCGLFDGKGHAQKNADVRQLLYYGLAKAASGVTLGLSGFFYWQHDFVEVDLSPPALKEFADGEFVEGKKIFDMLKVGVAELPAKPSSKQCYSCNWKALCPDSKYKKEYVDTTDESEVSLGETETITGTQDSETLYLDGNRI